MTTDHIENMLSLSTAHMPESKPDFGDVMVLDYEFGYLLFTTYPEDVAAWLKPAMTLADQGECRLIKFDCDALKHPDLPTWDW